ncbi:hypothetical protein [Tumebacillus lipolyticus]|uniref:Cell wall-binding repeat-containing protein n=1 Tax=Tumebacillus lipolyticus TaxID=1280370 RepID=A0ABW4ZT69_9BACL
MYEHWHPLFRQASTILTTRIVGSTAKSAAIGIAQTVFPASRPNAVLLTRPDCYPVALGATRLMHHPFAAVMLFTEGERLEEDVSRELLRLSPLGRGLPAQVIVIGAMHANVLHDVAALGFTVWHLLGQDLADTLGKIAECEGVLEGSHALLVSVDPKGGGVAAGSFAAASGIPILFASERGLSEMAVRFLHQRPRTKLIVVAPARYLSGTVEREVRRLGAKIDGWVAGRDGYETSVEFAKLHQGGRKSGFGKKLAESGAIAVVPAELWPIGTASAALSRRGRLTPLLLTRADRLPPPVEEHLIGWQARKRGRRVHGFVVGGYEVIHHQVQIALHRAIASDDI